MASLDLHWAIDVAHVLRRRHLADSGSASSRSVVSLIDILTGSPAPSTWKEVLSAWDRTSASDSLLAGTQARRIGRIREVLTRASAGLNTENLQGSAQFRMRTRTQNQLTTAQLLWDAGYHASARTAFHHVLNISERHEILDSAIRAACSLRTLAAAAGDQKELDQLDNNVTELHASLTLEMEALALQDRAQLLLATFTANRVRSARQYRKILLRLNVLASDPRCTAIVVLAHYRTQLWFASITRDAQKILQIAIPAVKYLDDHSFAEYTAYRAEFEGSSLTAMLAMKDFKGATAVWQHVSTRVVEGAANWAALLQIYFLVCLATRHFDAARDALFLYESKKKPGGPEWRIRLWHLYRAYILLLIDNGLLSAGQYENAPRIYAANLERQSKEFMDDKLISGAALYVLKILQWLRAAKYTEVVAEAESIRRYAHRYLSNKQTARTGVFLRMLATLPTGDFDPRECDRRGQLVWSKHREAHRLQRDSAEIVPYEVLWEITILILESNLCSRRR